MEMTCRFSKVWLSGGDIPAEMDLEINGDTMTITASSDDTWGELGLELPIVMKRVD